MDVVLIILGVLGFGAIVIAAYVFTVAARNYVSTEDKNHQQLRASRANKRLTLRRPTDRRGGKPVEFPLTVNGALVPQERRHLPDRRMAA
jgi:hypothetical protein